MVLLSLTSDCWPLIAGVRSPRSGGLLVDVLTSPFSDALPATSGRSCAEVNGYQTTAQFGIRKGAYPSAETSIA